MIHAAGNGPQIGGIRMLIDSGDTHVGRLVKRRTAARVSRERSIVIIGTCRRARCRKGVIVQSRRRIEKVALIEASKRSARSVFSFFHCNSGIHGMICLFVAGSLLDMMPAGSKKNVCSQKKTLLGLSKKTVLTS